MANTTKVTIVKRVEETADAVTLYFKKPFFSRIKYKSGQFLTLLISINGEEYRRAYSLSSSPGIDKLLSVTIKKVEGGIVSNYVFNSIKNGDEVTILKPLGAFYLMPKTVTSRHVVLWGGGSGITPLISIAKTVLYKERKSYVTLVYCNHNEASIIYKDKLVELENEYGDRLKVIHVLNEPSPTYVGQKGRLTPERVVELKFISSKTFPIKSEHYICGPSGLMEAVSEGLKLSGIASEQIFKESFTGTPGDSSPEKQSLDFEARTIKLLLPRSEHGLLVPANTTILDAALQNKLKMPYSCCSGSCATCMCEVKNGEVEMIGDSCLSDKDIKKGYVLACIAYPKTDEVVLKVV